MIDLIEATQIEVARLRDMIATTKALFPKANVNFTFYEVVIKEADLAIREQDATTLCKMLPAMKEMH